MKEILNFAIVGCGVVSKVHAKHISLLPEARLVAVCDEIADNAHGLAAPYGAAVYSDYAEMFKREDIDIVDILTPSGTHSRIGVAAAKAGKHVIVEKPIDITLTAADALIGACRASGVKLACIFQFRFEKDIIELKKAVDAGKLGRLNFCGSHMKWYRSQEYYDSGKWRGTWALDGGGALMQQSIHYVDLVQYIMGPVDEVFAYCATRGHERLEVEDIAVSALKFKSGAIGIIEATTAAYPGFYAEIDVFGKDGSVILKNQRIEERHLRSGEAYTGSARTNELAIKADDTVYAESKYGKASGSSEDTHIYQIQDMIDAVKQGREPLVNGEEGRKALEIVLAVYESSRTGKPVKL